MDDRKKYMIDHFGMEADDNLTEKYPTKQMLMGYMIEFCGYFKNPGNYCDYWQSDGLTQDKRK